jgi:hypothetical protein
MCLRNQEEKSRARQRASERKDFACPLIEIGHTEKLEQHHMLRFIKRIVSKYLRLALEVVASQCNHCTLESLQEIHGLMVHVEE